MYTNGHYAEPPLPPFALFLPNAPLPYSLQVTDVMSLGVTDQNTRQQEPQGSAAIHVAHQRTIQRLSEHPLVSGAEPAYLIKAWGPFPDGMAAGT